MWNSNAWAWMDFEIPGLLQMPDTWELGILGILLEVGNKTRYICVILDENLKNLEEIFPEYSLYNPELDVELILKEVRAFDPKEEIRHMFHWSSADSKYFKHYFGDFWDGKSFYSGGKLPSFGNSKIHLMNALPSCKSAGNRNNLGFERPHSLEKYLDYFGYKSPEGDIASNTIRELKSRWTNSSEINDYDKKLAYKLLEYNYHDCRGLRYIMRKFEGLPDDGDNEFEL